MNRPKIMIVDDNTKILYAFESLLEKEGCISVLAENGNQALTLLSRENPETVFLDISLPDVCGLDLIKKMKIMIPLLTVIVIVEDGIEDVTKEALKEGAFACLQKPLSVSNIRDILSKIKS